MGPVCMLSVNAMQTQSQIWRQSHKGESTLQFRLTRRVRLTPVASVEARCAGHSLGGSSVGSLARHTFRRVKVDF